MVVKKKKALLFSFVTSIFLHLFALILFFLHPTKYSYASASRHVSLEHEEPDLLKEDKEKPLLSFNETISVFTPFTFKEEELPQKEDTRPVSKEKQALEVQKNDLTTPSEHLVLHVKETEKRQEIENSWDPKEEQIYLPSLSFLQKLISPLHSIEQDKNTPSFKLAYDSADLLKTHEKVPLQKNTRIWQIIYPDMNLPSITQNEAHEDTYISPDIEKEAAPYVLSLKTPPLTISQISPPPRFGYAQEVSSPLPINSLIPNQLQLILYPSSLQVPKPEYIQQDPPPRNLPFFLCAQPPQQEQGKHRPLKATFKTIHPLGSLSQSLHQQIAWTEQNPPLQIVEKQIEVPDKTPLPKQNSPVYGTEIEKQANALEIKEEKLLPPYKVQKIAPTLFENPLVISKAYHPKKITPSQREYFSYFLLQKSQIIDPIPTSLDWEKQTIASCQELDISQESLPEIQKIHEQPPTFASPLASLHPTDPEAFVPKIQFPKIRKEKIEQSPLFAYLFSFETPQELYQETRQIPQKKQNFIRYTDREKELALLAKTEPYTCKEETLSSAQTRSISSQILQPQEATLSLSLDTIEHLQQTIDSESPSFDLSFEPTVVTHSSLPEEQETPPLPIQTPFSSSTFETSMQKMYACMGHRKQKKEPKQYPLLEETSLSMTKTTVQPFAVHLLPSKDQHIHPFSSSYQHPLFAIEFSPFSLNTHSTQVNQSQRVVEYHLSELPMLEELETFSLYDELLAEVSLTPDLDSDGYLFSITLKPHPKVEFPALKQDFLFVIDRSNSIEKHRYNIYRKGVEKALNYLQEGDRFNILVVDSKISKFKATPIPVSKKSIHQAKQFLQEEEFTGFFSSSNTYKILKRLNTSILSQDEITNVIYLTDGSSLATIEKKSSLIQNLLDQSNSKHSLYMAAASRNNNLSMLELLSNFHRGELMYSRTNAAFPRKLAILTKKLSHLIATDIRFTFGTTKANIQLLNSPEEHFMPNLYAGKSYTIYGKIDQLEDFELFVQGKLDQGWLNIRKHISFEDANKGTRTLWKKIAQKQAFTLFHTYLNEQNNQHLEQARHILHRFDAASYE